MNGRNIAFWLCICAAFLCWTVWCLLMVGVGEPFSLPLPRAFARVGSIAIPALVYLYKYAEVESDHFAIRNNWKLGLCVGCSVAFLQLAVLSATRTLDLDLLPTTAAVWANFILFSPLAEELLFRRVAVDYLADRLGSVRGVIASAVLFALIHLPWWFLSGQYSNGEMMELLATLSVYGLIFGALYRATGSLWASLVPHWVNNLAAAVFV